MSDDAGGEQGPEKGSIGLLAQVFPRGVVDAAISRAGVKELKNRALPARLMVYFVVGMWLWSDLGYRRVLRKVTAGLRWAAADADRTPVPWASARSAWAGWARCARTPHTRPGCSCR